MDIQSILQTNYDTVAALFQAYGINKKPTYDTLSAAIAIHASDNGNPFLADLVNALDGNDYDEWFGSKMIKKAKAKNQENKAQRQATGQKTRGGKLLQGVGRFAQKIVKKKPSEAAINTPIQNNLTKDANDSAIANDGATQTKVSGNDVIDTIGNAVSTGVGLYNQIKGGGSDDSGIGGGSDGGNDTGETPWYKKPMVLVGIGAGVLVLIVVIIFATKKK